MLLVLLASTQVAQADVNTRQSPVDDGTQGMELPADAIPTVRVPRSQPVFVPTVTIPSPTATPLPTRTPRPVVKRRRPPVRRRTVEAQTTAPAGQWIWAYLTSYCPGSAGWLASSGHGVFFGMLANDYYPFGTRVYIPVIGITGVVEDRIGSFAMWNHFDVWSPVCYSTPTGWFRVAVQAP